MARFRDRAHAGRELGLLVAARGLPANAVILALPRGGVPVAVEVAGIVDGALDVLVVRKLRTPGRPELAFGAVASGGVCWLNPDVRVSPDTAQAVVTAETRQVRALESRYRPAGFVPISTAGRTVVLVDDGIATGATVIAAVQSARLLGAAAVIAAAPVAPPDAVARLATVADRVDVVEVRRGFGAVSVLYDDFSQVPDADVAQALASRRSQS